MRDDLNGVKGSLDLVLELKEPGADPEGSPLNRSSVGTSSAGFSSPREGQGAASLIDSKLFVPSPDDRRSPLETSALAYRVKLLPQPSAPMCVVSGSFKDERMKREVLLFLTLSRAAVAPGSARCRRSHAEPLLARHRFILNASWGISFDRLSQIILLSFSVKSFNP